MGSRSRLQKGVRLRGPRLPLDSFAGAERADTVHHPTTEVLQRAGGHCEDRRQQQELQHRTRCQTRRPTQLLPLQRPAGVRVPSVQTNLGKKGIWYTAGAHKAHASY
eukprot:8588687-Pyramimonas_sp.AAC.1